MKKSLCAVSFAAASLLGGLCFMQDQVQGGMLLYLTAMMVTVCFILTGVGVVIATDFSNLTL